MFVFWGNDVVYVFSMFIYYFFLCVLNDAFGAYPQDVTLSPEWVQGFEPSLLALNPGTLSSFSSQWQWLSSCVSLPKYCCLPCLFFSTVQLWSASKFPSGIGSTLAHLKLQNASREQKQGLYWSTLSFKIRPLNKNKAYIGPP